MSRQGDDRHVRLRPFQRPGRDQAVHPGHRDIHHDDVRLQRFRLLEDVIAVSRLADDSHVGLTVDQQLQSLAHGRVVVREKDAERARHLRHS